MKLKYFLPLILLSSLLFAQNLTRHTVNLQRGLNTKIDKSVSGAPYVLENLLTDESIGFTTRTGITEISSAPIAGINNTKIWSVKFSNGEEFILAQYEKYLYFTSDKASWTLIRDNLKWQLNPLQMAVINDEIYFTNGIDYVFYVTGDLISGKYYADLPFIKKGKYILADKNKLFIANTYTYPSRVYYTLSGADPKSSDSWSEIQYVVAGFKDGDYITGLASFGRNQTLILNRSSIWGLFGYGPLTWGKPMKITSNYGCISQESVQMVRGKLYFLDRGGIVSYDGSFFDGAVDFVIEDDIKGSNNVKGEYRFWRQALSTDFDDATYNLRISTTVNEIKLQEFTATFNSSETFVDGSFSNIQITDDSLTLLETGKISERVSPNTFVTKYNFKEWSDPDIVFLYENPHRINDNLLTTAGTYEASWIYDYYFGTSKTFSGDCYYLYDYSNLGTEDYSKISIHDTTIWLTFKFEGNGNYAKKPEVDISVIVYALNTVSNNYDEVFTHTSTMDVSELPTNVPDWAIGYVSAHKKYNELLANFNAFNTETIRIKINCRYKVTFKDVGDTMFTYPRMTVSPVTEIKIYKQTAAPTYPSTGTYTSTTTAFGDLSQDVKFGTFTASAYTSLTEGTTLAFRTRTSTQTSTPIDTWSSWSDWSSTPTFKITSPDGKYLQFMSSFTTTLSSYTAILHSVDITALASTGTWISKKFNKGKQKVSKYFITDVSLNGQTANFWVKVATGSTALDSASRTSITSGSTITATTSETWIQLEVGLETTDGTQNPTVRSMTVLWSPEIEPVIAASLSKDDRYTLALSTYSGITTNKAVYVLQKNDEWTMYTGWTPSAFTSFGADFYMGDGSSNKIFKLSTSTTDNGTAITCRRKQSFYFREYSLDKWLKDIITVGVKKTGILDISYMVENNTNTITTNYSMAGTGRFRHRQRVRSSQVSSFEVIHTSTNAIEVFALELWFEPAKRLQK